MKKIILVLATLLFAVACGKENSDAENAATLNVNDQKQFFPLPKEKSYLCILARGGNFIIKGHTMAVVIDKGRYNYIFENPFGIKIGQGTVLNRIKKYLSHGDPSAVCEEIDTIQYSHIKSLVVPEYFSEPGNRFTMAHYNCTHFVREFYKEVFNKEFVSGRSGITTNPKALQDNIRSLTSTPHRYVFPDVKRYFP